MDMQARNRLTSSTKVGELQSFDAKDPAEWLFFFSGPLIQRYLLFMWEKIFGNILGCQLIKHNIMTDTQPCLAS